MNNYSSFTLLNLFLGMCIKYLRTVFRNYVILQVLILINLMYSFFCTPFVTFYKKLHKEICIPQKLEIIRGNVDLNIQLNSVNK